MATRDMRLDRLYQNRTKDVASLRTWDIDGARSQTKIRERRLVGQSVQADNQSSSHQPKQIFNQNEYNPLRNPMHYSDARQLEHKGVHLSSNFGENRNETAPREVRQDINSRSYKDTLEQYVENQEHSRTRNMSDVRQSMPVLSKKSPQEEEKSLRNQGNFYGVDPNDPAMYVQFTRQHVSQSISYNPAPMSSTMQKLPPVRRRQSSQNKQIDEQTIFMKQAMDNNILLKRDANSFFDGKGQETSSNFVRNYNEFYRGTTPDKETKQAMAKYGGNDIDPKTALGTKKQDVYLYDFFTHKPKYIYTTEASRMQKNSKHYDKYANDPKFKKAASNFFAVEAEFPKPDFSRRGPVTHDDQVTSLNRAYGGRVTIHL